MEAAGNATFARATAGEKDPRSMPRALLWFAHPDDETIALGGRLGRFRSAHMVHVTDGAPHNEGIPHAHGLHSVAEYRQMRREELDCVLKTAGISEISRECLDVPDQEASFELAWLTRRLLLLTRMYQPEAVFTHPFEGGHPDHDACAFAAHHAVALLRFRHEPAPMLIEAPFYHAGRFGQGLETGSFVPAGRDTEETVYRLSDQEQRQKQSLLDCYASQREMLSQFATGREHYRVAPPYDFRFPPNNGAVLYDNYSWGVKSGAFCELAWEAEDALEEEMKAACC